MADSVPNKAISRAVVSGATGFIGRRLVAALRAQGVHVTALVRNIEKAKALWGGEVNGHRIDFAAAREIGAVCQDADTVFHLAGYAHAEDANDDTASALHTTVTVEGTRTLLNEALRAGVQRFVFVSSVKAVAEGSVYRLDERCVPRPTTAYGRAKREAEKLVLEAGAQHDMHVTVLRLPLVYGPGSKGNLRLMMDAIEGGWLPPLPNFSNKRSMVHVEDVVRALCLVALDPRANGEVYFVTDGRAYSTYDICILMRRALGKADMNWKVPLGALKVAARIGDAISRVRGRPFVFRSTTLNKLLGSAWYSSEKIERDLGFRPMHNLDTALPHMVEECRRRVI